VNGIVEAIALNEEPKFLNWFKMSGAPHARAGVRHRFLKRLEIRGMAPWRAKFEIGECAVPYVGL
jgi:hypothetical protein